MRGVLSSRGMSGVLLAGKGGCSIGHEKDNLSAVSQTVEAYGRVDGWTNDLLARTPIHPGGLLC